MNKQNIRIKFTNASLMRTQQRLLDILRERFNILLVDESPDYVIGTAFDTIDTLKHKDAVKILFTGENIVPDFNFYDYAIGFDHLEFGDRYLRIPLYCFYPNFDDLCSGKTFPKEYDLLAKRKFCSFVVSNSNGADPIRGKFFKELCKYKIVDSAGLYLNNMGGTYLEDKQSFIANYKFNIAFENSQVDGYTTEKIMEPMAVNSIPIYWGNRKVAKDFNPQSFIDLSNFDCIKDCIDYIIQLDKDDDKYLSMLRQSWFNTDGGLQDYKERIWSFFDNIFSKPKCESIYLSNYGYQPYYRDSIARTHRMTPYEKTIKYLHECAMALKRIYK